MGMQHECQFAWAPCTTLECKVHDQDTDNATGCTDSDRVSTLAEESAEGLRIPRRTLHQDSKKGQQKVSSASAHESRFKPELYQSSVETMRAETEALKVTDAEQKIMREVPTTS